jgi:hypothetical protein
MRENRKKSFSLVEKCFDECFDRVTGLFPDFGTCDLYEDSAAAQDNGAGSERQYAYCMDGDPMVIAFAPKARTLGMANLRGLMRHEFGHALEYRYGVAELERRLGKLPETVERRADVIAERVWGDPIVYDQKLVQCVGKHGTHPRPRHLPDKKEKLKPNGKTRSLVGYHGARRRMDKPDLIAESKAFDWGPGLYLSTDPSDSIGYGSHLYQAEVRLTNPIVIDASGRDESGVLAWMKRALRIRDEDLSEYDNKFGGVFALYQTLVQMGEYKPRALSDALQKKGYDGVIVTNEAIRQHQPDMRVHGDYIVVWAPDQLLSWEEVSAVDAKAAYHRRWGE